MESSGILLGLIPLIAFVIVDSFAGIKTTLIVTSLMAILEFAFSLFFFKELDSITIFSLLSVLLLSFFSYQKKDSIFLKFQPVIFSCSIGLFFIVTFLRESPFLLNMFVKYSSFLPTETQIKISNPYFRDLLQNATMTVGISFILHGGRYCYFCFKIF